MRTIGDRERAAGGIAGIARRLHFHRIDVAQIDRVLPGHCRDCARECRRIVEQERASGAVIYAEWVVSGLDEELQEGAPAQER
jgi:hypothetical protein